MTEIRIETLSSPAERAGACAAIIAALPEWFGIPEANARYVRDAAALEGVGARRDDRIVGLLVHRGRHEPALGGDALEIHWMGVLPERHRQGLGARLVAAARIEAERRGAGWMTVETLDPEARDPRYLRTFAFYAAQGFEIVDHFVSDPGHPMIRLARRI